LPRQQKQLIVSSGYSNAQVMSNFKQYGFAGVLRKLLAIEICLELDMKKIALTVDKVFNYIQRDGEFPDLVFMQELVCFFGH
jgi:hypothetical protein